MRKHTIGGACPGEVSWIDDSVARVWCDRHAEPLIVYEAACHRGADLDDVVAVPDRRAPAPGNWIVGPRECVRYAAGVWPEDLDEEEPDVLDEEDSASS